ncbi:hypothetical protein [Geodermatophilus sp. SYSU D00710]
MDRQHRIDAVLARRRSHALTLQSVVERGLDMRRALADLDGEATRLAHLDGHAIGDAVGAVRRAVSQALNHLDAELAECQGLTTRMSRPTLTVGAVGLARMGKSRFLQSLTGLTAREIPDSSGGFCTGVTSLIRPGTRVEASVTFHSDSS